MRRLFLLLSLVVPLCGGMVSAAFADGALLTISGAVGKTNRGAFDPFHDGFLKFHDKSFDKAFEFDAAALAALPQQSITVDADVEDWPGPLEMEGPFLKDVLAAAGVSDASLTLYALDGFGLDLSAEEVAGHDWVLARTVDGKALGIGGFGPLWLVYDTGGSKAGEDEEKRWIWSVFLIEAQ